MSNKVYFSEKSAGKSPVWHLVRMISRTMYYLLPNWAAKKTADLLLTPQGKTTDLADAPSEFTLYKVDTEEGQLQCYEAGDGPIVLLTHGWAGGAYQFFPLMQKFAASGYKAIAFDHPGHGHSYGKHSSGPQFIRALQSVMDYHGKQDSTEIAYIVAHSMGCLAAANVNIESWKGTPLCLIAPAFGFKQNMIDKIHGFGLYPKLFDDLLQGIEKHYGVTIDSLEIDRNLPTISHKTLILHDKNDKFTDAKHSESFCAQYPQTRLVLSEGLGHGRIINADSTWEEIQLHIRSVGERLRQETLEPAMGQ